MKLFNISKPEHGLENLFATKSQVCISMAEESEYPDLFGNYLEFCKYRNEFLRTRVINLSNVSFLYPTTLLPLLNLITEYHPTNIIESQNSNVWKYLLTILGKDLDSSEDKSYIPLVKLPIEPDKCNMVLQHIYQLVRNYVFGGEEAFKYVVGELVDNIYQHSSFTKAMIMAQRYDRLGYTDLSFFDNGITIVGSFLRRGLIYAEGDSYKAISDAITGLSSKGGTERGYGLKSSVRIFLDGLEGEFLIVSGIGAIYLSNKEKYAYKLTEPYKLKGTLISLKVQNSSKQTNIYNFVE